MMIEIRLWEKIIKGYILRKVQNREMLLSILRISNIPKNIIQYQMKSTKIRKHSLFLAFNNSQIDKMGKLVMPESV